MSSPPALADLFGLLLGLPRPLRVAATASFAPWVAEVEWPPGPGGGLWLVDTADPEARDLPALWPSGSPPPFEAALVLADRGEPAGPLQRAVRALVGRPRRWSPRRAAEVCREGSGSAHVTRLGFDPSEGMPDGFRVGPSSPRGDAVACLVTAAPPFVGADWVLETARLSGHPIEIREVAVRARGAAVAIVEGAGEGLVVRLSPPGPFQDVIRRNHDSLSELVGRLASDPDLVSRIPRPRLATTMGPTLLLAETRVPGVLAWKLAAGSLAAPIRANSLAFLDRLRTATRARATREAMTRWTAEDRTRLDGAAYVPAEIRGPIERELDRGSAALPEGLQVHASHGDFGYGNILVDPGTGSVTGVIDWDTARFVDIPGVDRVNFEIQALRAPPFEEPFHRAAAAVWERRLAHEDLARAAGAEAVRPLFGLAVCRYILRATRYREIFEKESATFARALAWLQTVP